MFIFSSKIMKKFIKKISVFVIIIAIITWTVNFVYVKQKGSNPNGTNKFASIPDRIQICNFGSSHGINGFNYEDIGNDYACFNFALSGQFLSYDYRLFQYYSDHIDEGTVVFIPISYFSLFAIEEVRYDNFESKNQRYYFILPTSLIKEYNYQTAIFIRFPSLTANIDNLITTLLGINGTNGTSQQTADIDISEDAKNKFISHIKKHLGIDGDIVENQEEIDALYALVKGCQEKGAIPVLITTPYLHEYTDEVKENLEGFYDHFYSIINQVVIDTGAEYYDYAFDERFVNEYSWFTDSDHLNKEGARNFVSILMNEIVYEKGYY